MGAIYTSINLNHVGGKAVLPVSFASPDVT
jgi:hypothetical protein